MSSPLPVTVIRPRLTVTEALTSLLATLITFAINALIVMWLVPVVSGLHPSIAQSLAVVVLVRSLTRTTDYLQWTRGAS